MASLDVALAGRWAEWDGLGADVSIADVEAVAGPARRSHAAPPGAYPAEVVAFDGLRAWVRAERVELVALDEPAAPDGALATLATLGSPELEQPARFERFGFETTEHVWPRRGLVLVTAVPYEHSEEADRSARLARAELFAPTTLDAWRIGLARAELPARPDRWPARP
jgi:hypothetical protein